MSREPEQVLVPTGGVPPARPAGSSGGTHVPSSEGFSRHVALQRGSVGTDRCGGGEAGGQPAALSSSVAAILNEVLVYVDSVQLRPHICL